MKIIAISDTHTYHNDITIPECDFLIHAGDWTYRGEFFETRDFLNWFVQQPAKHRIFIAGNHELTLDPHCPRNKYNQDIHSMVRNYSDVSYLENQLIEVDGVRIYGSPVTPTFCHWAFNFDRGEAIRKQWVKIPSDIDILVTHTPPADYLDQVPGDPTDSRSSRAGCRDLLDMVSVVRPKLHIFGHLHTNGLKTKMHENGITRFVNAAVLDDNYQFRKDIKPYIEIEL